MINESNNVTIKRQENEALLTYKWYRNRYFFTSLIMGLMMLGIIIVFSRLSIFAYLLDLKADTSISVKIQVAFLCLTIPMLFISSFIHCLYVYFNETTITIKEKRIAIQHSPLPVWKGSIEFPVDKINKFHIEEKKHWSGDLIMYNLFVTLRDGSRIKILSNHRIKLEQIQEIKLHLEEHLSIHHKN